MHWCVCGAAGPPGPSWRGGGPEAESARAHEAYGQVIKPGTDGLLEEHAAAGKKHDSRECPPEGRVVDGAGHDGAEVTAHGTPGHKGREASEADGALPYVGDGADELSQSGVRAPGRQSSAGGVRRGGGESGRDAGAERTSKHGHA